MVSFFKYKYVLCLSNTDNFLHIQNVDMNIIEKITWTRLRENFEKYCAKMQCLQITQAKEKLL